MFLYSKYWRYQSRWEQQTPFGDKKIKCPATVASSLSNEKIYWVHKNSNNGFTFTIYWALNLNLQINFLLMYLKK